MRLVSDTQLLASYNGQVSLNPLPAAFCAVSSSPRMKAVGETLLHRQSDKDQNQRRTGTESATKMRGSD